MTFGEISISSCKLWSWEELSSNLLWTPAFLLVNYGSGKSFHQICFGLLWISISSCKLWFWEELSSNLLWTPMD